MNLQVIREVFNDSFTLGRMAKDGVFFGFTCEDTDRHLEDGTTEKVQNETAIPRGKYKVIISFSHHFQRELPEILDVPGFAGVRIHGGNTAADTDGCILLGQQRTENGCANCAERNKTLLEMLQVDEEQGITSWIEVI